MLVTYCFAYFASQTSGLCNVFPSVPFEVCTFLCLVSLCVLRLKNFGFVNLCACTSVPFGILHACVIMFCVRKHRVCAVFFPRPLLSFYACVYHVLLCVFSLTNIGIVQCFSLGPLLSLYALIFVMLCCMYFASQTSVLCSAFLSATVSVYTLILVMFCCAWFSIYMVLRYSPSKRWLCSSCRLFLFPWICLFHIFIFMFKNLQIRYFLWCYWHPVWRPIVSFSIVASGLPDLAPFLLSVQPYLVQFF